MRVIWIPFVQNSAFSYIFEPDEPDFIVPPSSSLSSSSPATPLPPSLSSEEGKGQLQSSYIWKPPMTWCVFPNEFI
jgi:hypothetical protein